MWPSKSAKKVQMREIPKDEFVTPLTLSRFHINLIKANNNEIWYDPFRNSGSYYKQFPSVGLWSEILDGKDFFEFNDKCDIICSNPPYSMIDKVLEKSVIISPRVISYLLGINNFTAKRLEYMNKHHYGLTNIHFCKVWKWFGMSVILVFEKNKKNMKGLTFDRQQWGYKRDKHIKYT